MSILTLESAHLNTRKKLIKRRLCNHNEIWHKMNYKVEKKITKTCSL